MASSYSVYDTSTYLCPKCDGYGWIHVMRRNGSPLRCPCQTCEGIGAVGGDVIEVRSTLTGQSIRGGNRLASTRLEPKRRESEGRPPRSLPR